MAWKRFVFAADNHGDMQDNQTVDLFFEFLDYWKPHHRWHGGDFSDARPFRVGASNDEKEESVLSDFEASMRFLEDYRPDILCRGNHDERWWREARKAKGAVRDLCWEKTRQMERWCTKRKCRMLPYDKSKGVFKVGRLKGCHGYFSGKEAAKNMAQAYGSVLFGHTHRIDVVSLPSAGNPGRHVTARSVGCLCKLDMDYNSRQPHSLAQANGWAYGVVDDRRGRYQVFQAEVVGGAVVFAENMRVIGAK